jgi:hypothetical protein
VRKGEGSEEEEGDARMLSKGRRVIKKGKTSEETKKRL